MCLHVADGLDDLHAPHHAPEHRVLVVQPRRGHHRHEELGPVGVGAGVGHGKDARAGVLQLEVLILELHSVDGLAASAVPGGEVSALRNIPNYYGSILIILTFVSFV